MSRPRLDLLLWPDRGDPALLFASDGGAYAVAMLPAAQALSEEGCRASFTAVQLAVDWGSGAPTAPLPVGWRVLSLAEFGALCDPALFSSEAPVPAAVH